MVRALTAIFPVSGRLGYSHPSLLRVSSWLRKDLNGDESVSETFEDHVKGTSHSEPSTSALFSKHLREHG